VSWKTVALGDVCRVIAGQSPAGKYYNSNGDGLPFYQGKKDFGKVFINPPTVWTAEVTKEAIKDDILMSVRAPVGPVNISTERICIGRGLAAIRASEKIDKSYLFNFLLSIEKDLVGSSGAVFNSINKGQIESIAIPLPPLATQQKIVAKLDAIFAEIDKATAAAEANAKNADLLVKGTITALINKFSKGRFVKFGNVCEFVRGPFGGSLKKSIFVEHGYAVYEQQHPINNQFETFRYFITDEKFNEMKRFEVFPGDLLMSCSGSLGKISIVPEGAPRGIINQALLKITPKDSVRKEYLKLVMESDYFQSILWDVSGGAAQPNVPSVKVIKDFLIPLPTINEQDDFIESVSSVLSYELSATYKEKTLLLMRLKQSILNQAFSGNLVRE
jgi:type I restriction enzyme S subunit